MADTDPAELVPLHESVDALDLDRLLAEDDQTVTVTFQYAGRDVYVENDGTIACRPAE